MVRRKKCPDWCPCLCHDTSGGVKSQHGSNGRCPTKDGLELAPEPDQVMTKEKK